MVFRCDWWHIKFAQECTLLLLLGSTHTGRWRECRAASSYDQTPTDRTGGLRFIDGVKVSPPPPCNRGCCTAGRVLKGPFTPLFSRRWKDAALTADTLRLGKLFFHPNEGITSPLSPETCLSLQWRLQLALGFIFGASQQPAAFGQLFFNLCPHRKPQTPRSTVTRQASQIPMTNSVRTATEWNWNSFVSGRPRIFPKVKWPRLLFLR